MVRHTFWQYRRRAGKQTCDHAPHPQVGAVACAHKLREAASGGSTTRATCMVSPRAHVLVLTFGHLSAVVLTLTQELLASNKPVNLTVVHSSGRSGGGMPLEGHCRDLERIRILAEQAVNPNLCLDMSLKHLDLYFDLDVHNLLIN